MPNEIELEEDTHFGMVARLRAGAAGLRFVPVRTFTGSDLPEHNDNVRPVESPFGDETVYAVPPLQSGVSSTSDPTAEELGIIRGDLDPESIYLD